MNEENSVGWGLKDGPFFEQSAELMKSIPQPFYTRLITLTNHFPFDLDEEDKLIDEYDSKSKTLNQYFPTVRYQDEALKLFFKKMRDFPDSPMVKTPRSHCRGPGLDPWLGN